MIDMDTTILNYLNSFAGKWVILDQMVVFKAEYLGWWMLGGLGLFLIISAYFKNRHPMSSWTSDVQVKQMVFVALLSAFFSRFFITDLVRFFYSRPRPFETMDIYQLVAHDGGSSFPSGHAAFFFALAAGVFIYYRKWGILFYLFALAMGISRVIAGVHFPSDILGGAVIGIVSAYLVFYITKKYREKSR